MRITLLVLIILYHGKLFSQISSSDSSVFVVGNWSNYDNQAYEISIDRYSVADGDTSSNLTLKYEVFISVKDSSYNQYVLEWRYRNLKSKNKKDRINKRLHELGKNVPLLIKTDDTGQFLEVLNWEQVRDNMYKEVEKAKKEYLRYPNAQLAYENKLRNYHAQADIEATGIADVLQLLFFHGIHYKQGKETSFNDPTNIVLRNHNGSNGTLSLLHIDETENKANLQYKYIKATFPPNEVFSKPIKNGAKVDILDEKYPLAKSEHTILSEIDVNTGWVLQSTEEVCISYQNMTTIEKRVIKNKKPRLVAGGFSVK